MSTEVQRRRGTTAQHASFTGAAGELTVDTDKNVVVVHDAATAGGFPMVPELSAARRVMASAIGGTGTEDGAGTWCRLATFTLPTDNNTLVNIRLLIVSSVLREDVARIDVAIAQSSGLSAADGSAISVSAISNRSSLSHDSFLLTASAATNGTDVELWMQKSLNYGQYTIYEAAKYLYSGASVAYNDSAAWQSTTPTGAVTIASDWSGSGQLTSTVFRAGWAGTAYYERLENGLTLFHMATTTAGTTTDGTWIFTLPAGYCPGVAVRAMLTDTGGTDGADGYVIINTDGTVLVYDYAAGTPHSIPVSFMARN